MIDEKKLDTNKYDKEISMLSNFFGVNKYYMINRLNEGKEHKHWFLDLSLEIYSEEDYDFRHDYPERAMDFTIYMDTVESLGYADLKEIEGCDSYPNPQVTWDGFCKNCGLDTTKDTRYDPNNPRLLCFSPKVFFEGLKEFALEQMKNDIKHSYLVFEDISNRPDIIVDNEQLFMYATEMTKKDKITARDLECWWESVAIKKKYRVHAEVISDVYVDIEANSEEEALQIAEDMDGSEFVEDHCGGEFKITSAYLREEPEEELDR